MITTEIRDNEGRLLGKLYRSTSFVHIDDSCESKIESEQGRPFKLELRKKEDKTLLLQVIIRKPSQVEINGIWFIKGLDYPIIATKDYVDINTIKISNSRFYGNRNARARASKHYILLLRFFILENLLYNKLLLQKNYLLLLLFFQLLTFPNQFSKGITIHLALC